MRADSMKGISMEIGDYGWIECKGENDKYTGWFLRAKVDGKVTYINKEDTSFMFPDTRITSQSDDFILHYKVAAIDALNGKFPNLTKEDMEKRNIMIPIENRIKVLDKEIHDYQNQLDVRNKELVVLKSKLYEIEHGIVPTYKLVYGVHDLSSCAKEFAWINDKDLDIEVGDIIEVDTSYGVERAIVTRLETSKVENNHKSVVSKVDKLP